MLLEQLGVPFDVRAPAVDEVQLPFESPSAMVERIARLKTAAVEGSDLPVLAADTVVVLDGSVLGKPNGPAEATQMLRGLANRMHTVATGVAVRTGARVRSSVVTAEVSFTSMTDDEIAWYVATGEPLDKAGSYGLNGIGNTFVRSVAGSPSTVIGLPVAEAVALLRSAGVRIAGR